MADENQGNLGRRAVLCGALAIVLGVTTDIAKASVPAVGWKQVGNKIRVSIEKNKVLANIGGAVTLSLATGATIAVVRTSADRQGYTALNLACTHNGAVVVQQGASWICPAHGSQYANDGTILRGPGWENLYKYPTSVREEWLTIG